MDKLMNASMFWKKEMLFQCNNHGLLSETDGIKFHGGGETAPTPKELLINAMMGCTAMDVVSILKKMRQELKDFKMEINVEKTEEHPIHFKTAELIYHLSGPIEDQKAIKAVEASLTKYCGVNYIVSKSCKISFKLFLNGNLIKTGLADFENKAS